MTDAYLEGNAILTDRDLTVADLGAYTFEVVGQSDDAVATPVYQIDIRIERYDIRLNVLHGTSSTQLNFPNALYDLLGAECGFDAYTPLADANLPVNERLQWRCCQSPKLRRSSAWWE